MQVEHAGLVSSALAVQCHIFQHGVWLHGDLKADMECFVGPVGEVEGVSILSEIDCVPAESPPPTGEVLQGVRPTEAMVLDAFQTNMLNQVWFAAPSSSQMV